MAGYDSVLSGVSELLEAARRTSARATNAIMTATDWEIGRRIVEHEQGGTRRAEYGELLLERLAGYMTKRFGRGFGRENLRLMRQFYVSYGCAQISRTLSGESITEKPETASAQFTLKDIANRFPLPWSHYVRLLSIKSPEACSFYRSRGTSRRMVGASAGSLDQFPSL